MKMMRVIGIDPGLSGAIAITDGETVDAIDLPIIGEGTQRELDGQQILTWIADQHADLIVCELVHAMPKQGVASSFRFGFAVGQLRAIMQCSSVRYALYVPTVWKKHYGLRGKDKDKSRQLALRLFPSAAGLLRRKRDHQRAEAMLIANYGKMNCERRS
jgi:crossover junction endodeoxyribonuclease RuvC